MGKIYLQSNVRERGTNNEPEFEFKGDSTKFVRSMRVVSASIPLSFYHVQGDLNWSYLGFNFTTTIVSGNYTANQLATALELLMQVSEPSVTIAYDINTYKFTISSTLGTIIFGTGSLNEILGYSTENTNILADNTAPNIIYLRPTSLFLKSYNVLHGLDTTYRQSKSSVIARIPVDQNMGSVLNFQNWAVEDYFPYRDKTNVISLALYDDNDNLLDFNGAHWHVTLAINLFGLMWVIFFL